MTVPDRKADRWLRRFATPSPERTKLICFPHAGGSAAWYFPLSRALAGSVDVVGVQYPGRLDRYADPLIDDVATLADEIFEVLRQETGSEIALFGHSMGSVLAYEVARRLQEASTPVAHLFVSGRYAPDVSRSAQLHLLDDDSFVAAVEAMGGVPAGALHTQQAREMFLPPMRSDYRAIESYRHNAEVPLTVHISVLTGDRDPMVSPEEASGWCRHTSGRCAVEVFSGEHFYLEHHWSDAAKVIIDRLLRGRSSAARTTRSAQSNRGRR